MKHYNVTSFPFMKMLIKIVIAFIVFNIIIEKVDKKVFNHSWKKKLNKTKKDYQKIIHNTQNEIIQKTKIINIHTINPIEKCLKKFLGKIPNTYM